MRLLQGCVNVKRTRLQCYMDDPYFLLRGTKTARDKILTFLCLHIATVGITMAWHKAVRGPDLEWIGVLFQLRVAERAILMTINEKIAKNLGRVPGAPEEVHDSLRRLRSLTGRLAWAAKVVPRTRWTASILYAVLRVHAEDLASGAESQRRSQKTDKQPEDFKIPTKRVD